MPLPLFCGKGFFIVQKMKTYVLSITGQPALEIEGKHVASFSSQGFNGNEQTRWFDLDFYEDSEGLVAHVQLESRWQGEIGNKSVIEAENHADLLQQLQEYDPIQYLEGYPPGPHFAEKQQRLEDQMTRQWGYLIEELSGRLGITQKRRSGKPPHPLGPCKNPGWSIPEQVREAVDAIAEKQGVKPSEVATNLLKGSLGLG